MKYPSYTYLIALLALLFIAPNIFSQSQVYTTSGTFTVPVGVTSVTVEAWGAGGTGGSAYTTGTSVSGGGGGGGAYSKKVIPVTALSSYNVVVGAAGTSALPLDGGDSYFISTATILARGGKGVPDLNINGGAGGVWAAANGDAGYSGGKGGNGLVNSYGGGGGSSAGTNAIGNNGSGSTGGTAPIGGGAGASGATGNRSGDDAAEIGAGGGGSKKGTGAANFVGGSGANGQVVISWTAASCSYFLSSTTASTAICSTDAALVTINATALQLPTGTYTVTYDTAAPNLSSGNTATMTVNTAGTGTFSTFAFPNAGSTVITITRLNNGSCNAVPTGNRTATITINATPTITSTTPGSRLGTGTVTLSATASAGTISWYEDATGGTAVATGTSFTTPPLVNSATYYVQSTNGTCTTKTRTAITATINNPEIVVSGNGSNIADDTNTTLTTNNTNMGSTTVGTTIVKTFLIENIGTVNLTVGTITIGGANASNFTITTAPASNVAPGASTTFSIRYTATAIATHNATISFATNDADEDPFNFSISGAGITGLPPEINLVGLSNNILDGASAGSTTNGTDYGSLLLGSSVTRTFTIQNTGSGTLNLTGTPVVYLTGSSDFAVISQPSSNTIVAGGSLTFTVRYTPTTTGGAVAIVNILNNDADEGLYDFVVQGSGAVAGVEIDVLGNDISIASGSTTPNVFNQTDFGITDTTTAIAHVFNISSDGTSNLTLTTTVSVTGANASYFTASAIPSATLAPGAVTSFKVTFTPNATVGVKNATITITNNDPNEGTYTFNVRAENKTLPTLTIAPGGITSDLKLWLKADSNIGITTDTDKLNTWTDQSYGSTRTANAKFSREPSFQNNSVNNVNFNPVVKFNGNASMSAGQGFYNSDMYVLVKSSTTVNYTSSPQDLFCGDDVETNIASQDVTGFQLGNTSARYTNEIIAYNQAANTAFGIGEITTAKSYVGTQLFNARKASNYPTGKMELLNNGSILSTTSVNPTTYKDINNSRYWLGRSEFFEESFAGDILEIITYSTRKTDAERNKIESYLAIKYGITLGVNGVSTNYINSSGSTLYNANAGYNYNIAGIGRDDNSALNQKQSKTENTVSDITIGLGDIFATNSANSNTFDVDKKFLIWGHNNNSLAAQTPVVVNMSTGITPALTTSVSFVSIGRSWRVIENGGDVPICKISIPTTMLTATITPPGDFLMFISDTPVFDPTAEYRIMTVNGTNLETTYDFNGTKYITFGYAPEKTFVRSIKFNGTTDYLDAGKVLNLNTSFTVSAWVNPSAVNKTIFSKRDSAFTTGYELSINAAGKAQLSWMNSGTKRTITSNAVLPLGKWHHLGVIYNGTIAKFYVDGVTVNSATLPTVPTNTQSFLIGAADGTTPTSFFSGWIDEVRVWNTALTEAQYRYVMNQEILKNSTLTNGSILPNTITKNDISAVPWSNLDAYYPMSTYTYTNAKDMSSNSYTAALRNIKTVDLQTAPLPHESQASGLWTAAATWLNNAVQDNPYSVSIEDTSKTIDWNIVKTSHAISSTGNKTLLGLIVNSNTLSANNNTKIELSHYLKLDGKIDLVDKSQLVQTEGSDLDVTSTGSIEKDQLGQGNKYNYNYWGSPVGKINSTQNNAAHSVADVMRDGTTTTPQTINWIGGYDGTTGTPISIAKYWLYKFDTSSNSYANWTQINETGSLRVGQGFTMKGNKGASTTQNYTFVGKPNNGTISSNSVGASQLLLAGNPYASSLDATAFINDNLSTIDGNIYFWEHYTTNSTHNLKDYQGGYAVRNLTGGAPASAALTSAISGSGTATKGTPNQFIPVGQGFFVYGKTGGGGTLVFKNSQRSFHKEDETGVSNATFRVSATAKTKNAEDNSNDVVVDADQYKKIRLGYTSAVNFHRQVLLGFMNEKATNNFDNGYDAYLFDSFPNDMTLYNNGIKLVIQGEGYFDSNATYPLAVKADQTGIVSFSVDGLENFDEKENFYILDKDSNTYTSIKENPFQISIDSGEYLNRFELTFKNGTETSTEQLSVNSPENKSNEIAIIHIQNSSSVSIENKTSDTIAKKVILYDMAGKVILTWETEKLNQESIQLPLTKIGAGVYIIAVQTNKGKISKQIIMR